MRRMSLVLIVLMVFFGLMPVDSVYGVGQAVKVSLPGFPVTLNDQTQDSSRALYPFLVYKDITYVPATYSYCSLLGLESSWSSEEGLQIDRRDFDVLGHYKGYRNADNANKAQQTAHIADLKIRVNGKDIDNNQEEYPLLFFRDITYFPLTWRFAVDEFAWEYSFDHEAGLVIMAESKSRITLGGNQKEGLFYYKDGIKIYVDTNSFAGGLGGPPTANIYITRGGETRQIGEVVVDNFGYAPEAFRWVTGSTLDLQGEWLYTTWGSYWQSKSPKPCRVNINTGEIEML